MAGEFSGQPAPSPPPIIKLCVTLSETDVLA